MLVLRALCSSSSGWLTMEGSSDSARQKSGSLRGFNTSGFSERNIGSLHSERFDLLGDSYQDFVGLRKARERLVSARVDNLRNAQGFSHDYGEEATVNPYSCALEWDDVSLRHWLDEPERQVDELECLHIFTQIVEIVNVAHLQGVVVQNVRPSCFVMSSVNRVSFLESAFCSDSGSDSVEDRSNSRTDAKGDSSSLPLKRQQRGRLRYETSLSEKATSNAPSGISCMHSSSVYPTEASLIGKDGDHKVRAGSKVEQGEEKSIFSIEASFNDGDELVHYSRGSCWVY